jgi:hypothetical protein
MEVMHDMHRPVKWFDPILRHPRELGVMFRHCTTYLGPDLQLWEMQKFEAYHRLRGRQKFSQPKVTRLAVVHNNMSMQKDKKGPASPT